jgi:hypothetical protein
MKRLFFYTIALFVCALAMEACVKDEDFTTDASVKLDFSSDTLRFDTVFTQRGSAVRYFKVRNTDSRPLRISRIYLKNGSRSKFTLNVDGTPGREFSEVEVFGKDSIYVFATVTIDPNQPLSISPFVVDEKLVFETNGNVQEVTLEAWGQNANYFPSRFNKSVPVILSCNFQEISFNDPKPYVIYGQVFIDSCTLNIPAGTRIYVHGGIVKNDLFGVFNDGIIYVLRNGRIRIQGTKDKPVQIQGDRLEESFQDKDGQWNGLIIGRGSRGNQINYATIKNSIFGVYVDSAADLTIRNTRIFNTSSSGLIGVHSRITADNCLIYNNQATSLNLIHGGDYNFTYCTVASYGVNASALGMNNFRCYGADPNDCRVNSVYRLNATFRNCILFGSDRDEIEFNDGTAGQAGAFNVKMENCIVRVQDLLKQQNNRYASFLTDICAPCQNGKNTDKLFKDPNKDIYILDSLSIADGQAKPILSPRVINTDIDDKARNAQKPDVGCYERQQ